MDRRRTEMRTRAGAVRTGGLSEVKLNSRWIGTILGLCILASACSATSGIMSLDVMISHGLGKMAVLRVLRVERLAGIRMALARVEEPLHLTTKGALVAIPAQPIYEGDSRTTDIRAGDRLWLVAAGDWPSDASRRLRVPGAGATRNAVMRRWGPQAALMDTSTEPIRRFAGTEWVSPPDLALPETVRTRTQGKRTWFHFGDIERYIRQGLIEDPTLVRFAERSHTLAVGTMRDSTRGGWVVLRIERVLAVRDAAIPPAVGEELQFQAHPSWCYDVRYGEPMLWFLKRRSDGFCFTSIESADKVFGILRRRKGWIEMKSFEHLAPTPRRRLAAPYLIVGVLAAVLVTAVAILLRMQGARPVEQSA